MLQPATPFLPPVLAGVKVFPCVPNGKLPATQSGWKEASDDPDKLAQWHELNPGFNWAVACGMSGLFVVDVDPSGLLWWKELLMRDQAIRRAVEATFQVRTPRGGLHIYFRGEGPSTAGRISEGIDTRGGIWRDGDLVSGGYVVLPGSSTPAGSYEVLQDFPIRPLPAEVAALVPERAKGDVHGLAKNPDLDQPRNVAWATDLLKGYVRSGRVSVQGQGGNDLAFRVVASIVDKALSPGTAYDLLLEHWNEHCQPPWEDWELETLVRNAAEYAEQGKTGAKGMQSNADAFAGFQIPAISEPENELPLERRKLVWLMDDYEAQSEDITWLLPGFLPSEGVGMLFGPSGSYKTFLALDMASCLAHGIPGQWGAPPVQHDVLYLAGEQPKAMSRKRRPAWREWQGQQGCANRLHVVDHVPFFHDNEAWTRLKIELATLDLKPSLIILDTLSRFMTGMDESNTKEANMVVDFLEKLARYYECFVLVLHHTGKDLSKGARGSSIWQANLDVLLETRKKEGGTALHARKLKEVDEPAEPYLFQKKEVLNSIVLERCESLREEAQAGETKNDWATPARITKLLLKSGRVNTRSLASMIASDVGVGDTIVRKVLRADKSLAWFRDGDFWELPQIRDEL